MIRELQTIFETALKGLGIADPEVIFERPGELSHGDYATNVAMMYAKELGKNPKVLAEEITLALSKSDLESASVASVSVAGPGFINIHLVDSFFPQQIADILNKGSDYGKNNSLSGKKIMVEYTDPNPFKPFHIGHLMTNAIGESIVRLVEISGAEAIRANYQGDVGPHVAKAIWGMMASGEPKDFNAPVAELAEFIGMCYSRGAFVYEEDISSYEEGHPDRKKEIDEINKKIYERSDPNINYMYDWGKKVTLDAFEEIYKTLGTHFDRYYFESETAPIGEKIVRENIGAVFEESDGAIVFKGEKHDPKLHTRVFINSQGLPTYETKEVGLTVTKFKEYNPDISIVATAVEQAEYMRVVEKAISLLYPDFASRMKHITHGMMRFATGKMSSRLGNVITGESLIRDVRAEILTKIADRGFDDAIKEKVATAVGVAALKYSILKQSLGGDITYDFEKSISFEGDSGPYLQYTYVRAKSILEKAKEAGIVADPQPAQWEITTVEKLLCRFPETVRTAIDEYAPHHIATYLIELARAFNTFYGNTKIIDTTADAHAPYKVALTEAVSIVLKNGLYLLGIDVPEKM